MQAPLPMCMLTGPEHRFALANGGYVELVGREVLGKPIRGAFTDVEAHEFVPILDEVYRTGEPVLVRETPLRLADAGGNVTERFIDVGYHPYRDAARIPKGVLVVIQDVTAQVEARRRLEELAAEREAEIRERDDFLSIASHELRTPLTGLKLQVQSAKRSLEKNEPAVFATTRVAKLIEQTDRGLGRMTNLVEDMLDVSRIQSGRLQLHREPVNFAEVVRETLERFAPELEHAAIEVVLEASGPVTVEADRGRLEQVLTNLITNAIRYAPGAPIRATVLASGERARLLFEDGGPGIPQGDHSRVFERFERLHPGRNTSGLGIGLFIAREIVQAHGGQISLESAPGAGARFIVELPTHRA